jgi:hypothetical protein
MTLEQVGITAGLVIGITFLFDVMELQPQIGFGFLRSLNYFFYHSFRVIIGLLASVVIFGINSSLALPLIAFIAVFTSVSTLQNFTVNIGGSEVARLSSLLDNFRDRMISEERQRNVRRAEKLAQQNAAAALLLQDEMVKQFSPAELETYQRRMLLQAGWGADEINGHMDNLKQVVGENDTFLPVILAYEMADMNMEYVQSLIAERQRLSRDSR